MSGLLPVEDALQRLLAMVDGPTRTERVPLEQAVGRVLAGPLMAQRTQPPFRASAMDGYAARAADLADGKPLRLMGESAAGHGFQGTIRPGETVRIFTGAPVPDGADVILIQENARIDGSHVLPLQAEPAGRFLRDAGIDFREGRSFFDAGYRLRPKDMTLAASLGSASVSVRRAPRVAVLATGDELVLPGEPARADQIVASNHLAVAAIAAAAGASPHFLGIAPDRPEALASAIAQAAALPADVLVTLGGASVGDHDLVQAALTEAGMTLGFWRIAMRPGKPLMSGRIGRMLVLGLPGNPVSSVVCAQLFLKPLIRALLGAAQVDERRSGTLGRDLPANDQRQDYLRATLAAGAGPAPIATPLAAQDSSLTSVLAAADALVIREPHAPAARIGDPCQFLVLD